MIYTARWPLFARVEAVLLFPATVVAVSHIPLVVAVLRSQFMFNLSHRILASGPGGRAVPILLPALFCALPFITLTIAADRLLGMRKGFALLSAVLTVIWISLAVLLAPSLSAIVPVAVARGTSWISFQEGLALMVAGIALMLHMKPFWFSVWNPDFVAMPSTAIGASRSMEHQAFGFRASASGAAGGRPKAKAGRSNLIAIVGMAAVLISSFHFRADLAGAAKQVIGDLVPARQAWASHR